jgi:endonuclease/exonuclease/phosphatase family metal-dependent hydrolase
MHNLHHVIVAGDFNDHGTQEFWRTGLMIKGQNVTSKGIQPPPTCCTPMAGNTLLRSPSNNTDTLYGDYILISDGLRYRQGNRIPPQFNIDAMSNPTSDHLPIEASIDIDVKNTGGKRRRRTKRIKTKRRYRKKTKRNY